MDLGHTRSCVLQDHLHDGPFNQVVGAQFFNDLHFRQIGVLVTDLPQIVFRAISVRARWWLPSDSPVRGVHHTGGKPP
jgi:hypothetical protein